MSTVYSKAMTIKQLESIVGTLSKPSKMPCFGYSIPAYKCKIGSKLRKIKNSVCFDCYAMKGRYSFGSTKAAMEKRFDSISNPDWADTIAKLIKRKEKSGFFRWHDSGDLQSVAHLEAIVWVAELLPNIKFWLPTREYNIVEEYLGYSGKFPENLTVRLSALTVDESVKESQNPYGLPTSEVSRNGHNCPSFNQGGKCLTCRKCWDKNEKVIIYKKH